MPADWNLLFRLNRKTRVYEQVDTVDDSPVEAAGVPLRMVHVGVAAAPCVQWWDPKQKIWRDHASDRIRLGVDIGKVDQTLAFVDVLRPGLAPDARAALEANWRAHGLPAAAAAGVAALAADPGAWRGLLADPDPAAPAPREPRESEHGDFTVAVHRHTETPAPREPADPKRGTNKHF